MDQLAQLIHKIKTDPNDRRLVLSAWNPAALKDMALPPCHMFCQVRRGGMVPMDGCCGEGLSGWACPGRSGGLGKGWQGELGGGELNKANSAGGCL